MQSSLFDDSEEYASLRRYLPVLTAVENGKGVLDVDTVKGCMRTVVINAFNVKKTVKAGETTIEFTPTRTGPIEIICGMNMGKGSFTVAEPK